MILGAQNGHAAVVEMLLAAGADKDLELNVRDSTTTPTNQPATHEDDESYKALPSSCRTPSPYQQDGATALILSAYFGHDKCLGFLIKASARLDFEFSGKTALGWAKNQNRPKCVALLKAANAP